MSYNIFWALQSIASGTAGSTLLGDDNSYSNFTPSAATIKGALSGIDSAIGAFNTTFALRNLSNLTSPTAINQDLIFNKANALVKTKDGVAAASENISIASGDAPTTFSSGLVVSKSGSVVNGTSGSNSMRSGNATGTGVSGDLILATGSSVSAGSGNISHVTGLVSTSGNSGTITTSTGNSATAGNSGALFYESGTSASGATGALSFFSGAVLGGAGSSGNILLNSGNSTGNSGYIILQTGTAVTTRGAIRFVDGSESGGAGYVWTLQDTLGSGMWAPAAVSFDPNAIVSNFTVDPTFGDWYVATGDQPANVNSGYVRVLSGNTTGTGMSGNVLLETGTTTNGNSGSIVLSVPVPTGTGIQGNIYLMSNDIIANAESLQLHRQTTFAPKLKLYDNMDVWSVSLEAPPTLVADISFVLPDTVGTTGQSLTTDGLGNLSWTSLGNGWTKYVINYNSAGLPVASLTNDIQLFSLPAKGTIDEIVIHHTTPFSGPGITGYTVSVGIVGNLVKYAAPFNVFQAASDTTFEATLAFNMENFGASTSIRVAAISTGANLDQATAGSVEIYVRTSTLPA